MCQGDEGIEPLGPKVMPYRRLGRSEMLLDVVEGQYDEVMIGFQLTPWSYEGIRNEVSTKPAEFS